MIMVKFCFYLLIKKNQFYISHSPFSRDFQHRINEKSSVQVVETLVYSKYQNAMQLHEAAVQRLSLNV